jgi:hypothetical protein
MPILRLTIVLLIIALFMPSSAEEKQQVYRSVSEAVQNVSGFCERNARLCDTVHSVANAAADRAYYGAQLVYEAALGTPWADSNAHNQGAQPASRDRRPQERGVPDRERPYPSYFDSRSRPDDARMRAQPARSSDTLRREDRAPEWRGPGAS